MNGASDALEPPERLAIAHAGAALRPLLSFLLRFDVRLGRIVLAGGEVMIGQMRMAWWRDVISGEGHARPQGEPMIAEISALEDALGSDLIAPALRAIVDGWDLLLAHAELDAGILDRYAHLRAEGVFAAYAQAVASENREASVLAGKAWALNDMALHRPDLENMADSLATNAAKLPLELRPLSILAMAAGQRRRGGGIAAGLRLSLHALTGW